MPVSQAAAKLFTNPARVAVTTSQVDTWSVDMATSLNGSETIQGVSTRIVRFLPLPEVEVDDFVTSEDVEGETVVIGWNGGVLTVGEVYRLEVAVTLNTGAVVPRLMFVEVPA